MRIKLNGWQRIGIVLSVIWFLGFAGYAAYIEYVWFYEHGRILSQIGGYENIDRDITENVWQCIKGYHGNAELDVLSGECRFLAHMRFVVKMLAWGLGGLLVGCLLSWKCRKPWMN